MTRGKNKEEVAARLAEVGKSLRDLGFSYSTGNGEYLPDDKDDALEIIDRHAETAFPDGVANGGDRFTERNEDEIWGFLAVDDVEYVLTDDLDKEVYGDNPEEKLSDDEILEIDGRKFVVSEADLSQGVLAEDECGYGLWSEAAENVEVSDIDDERIGRENDLYFNLINSGIQFVGSPLEPDSIDMLVDYSGQVTGSGFEPMKYTVRDRLESNLGVVEGAEYEGDTGLQFRVKVSLEGEPEQVGDRVDRAYSAAITAIDEVM